MRYHQRSLKLLKSPLSQNLVLEKARQMRDVAQIYWKLQRCFAGVAEYGQVCSTQIRRQATQECYETQLQMED